MRAQRVEHLPGRGDFALIQTHGSICAKGRPVKDTDSAKGLAKRHVEMASCAISVFIAVC